MFKITPLILFVLFLLSPGCSGSMQVVSSGVPNWRNGEGLPVTTTLKMNGTKFKVGDEIVFQISLMTLRPDGCVINPAGPWWEHCLRIAEREFFEKKKDEALIMPDGQRSLFAVMELPTYYTDTAITLYRGDTLSHTEKMIASRPGKYRAVFQIDSSEYEFITDPDNPTKTIRNPGGAWVGKTEPIWIDFEVVE